MRTVFILLAMCFGLVQANAHAQTSEQVIAVINENIITLHDLKQRSILVARQLGDESLSTREDIQERALNELVDELLKIDYAEKLGIELADDAIDRFNDFMKNNPNLPAGVYAQMTKGLEESVSQQIRGELMWRQVVERTLRPRVVISDAEVNNLLQGLIDSNDVKEYQVRHIFIEHRADREPSAKQRIETLAKELTPETDFAAMARRYSEDGTAEKGGLLGWVNTSEIVPALAKALENIDVGGISKPVRSGNGWHILKLDDMRSAPPPSGDTLENARERIRETLTTQRLELTTRRLMRDLRRRAFIDIRLDS